MEPILECRKLYKDYPAARALAGVDLTLYRGRIVGLVGPNGSGKTTLLKIAAGLLKPSGGEILIGGEAPGPQTKKIVSYLPERAFLPDWMTAQQLVDMYVDFFPDFSAPAACDRLRDAGVSPKAAMKTLSKGTRDKIQLILAMSRRAQLYLLDEPIGGVDPAARDYILQTVLAGYDRVGTILISTHLISDVEKILDEVVFLHNGSVELCTTADEIRAAHGCSVDQYFREVYRWQNC